MLAKAYSATPRGVDALFVTVEVDRIRSQYPSVVVVGLPDTAVREARERIFMAFHREAGAGEFKGILLPAEEPLVSIDYLSETHSSIVDLPSTMMLGTCSTSNASACLASRSSSRRSSTLAWACPPP